MATRAEMVLGKEECAPNKPLQLIRPSGLFLRLASPLVRFGPRLVSLRQPPGG